MPEPGAGEVLVKVMAAPMNPSDMYFLKGMYTDSEVFDIQYPSVPGWECAGIVVKSGGGLMAWKSLGKRVAAVRKVEGRKMIKGGSYQ